MVRSKSTCDYHHCYHQYGGRPYHCDYYDTGNVIVLIMIIHICFYLLMQCIYTCLICLHNVVYTYVCINYYIYIHIYTYHIINVYTYIHICMHIVPYASRLLQLFNKQMGLCKTDIVYIRSLFEEFDEDKSGGINASELRYVMRSMGFPANYERIQEIQEIPKSARQ